MKQSISPGRLPRSVKVLLRVSLLAACHLAAMPGAAATTKLSENGKAVQPIIVAPTASAAVKAAATTLSGYLAQMSGGPFEVKEGDGASGIAVGTAADFAGLAPMLNLPPELGAKDAARREDYLLRSHAKGLWLIGNTEEGVQHAVWDLLYHLGYRQFFPGKNWEIVPKQPSLATAIDDMEHPSYLARGTGFTYGTWPDNAKRVAAWNARNRGGGMSLNTGHAYGEIIHRNQAEFDAHPEYFASVGGKRMVGRQGKFDISNPGLRKLVVNYALDFFARNPTADSVSLDPSDGGNWGDSPAELKLGSISDRVVILANEVADAVSQKYPGKYVAFYAYNYHSPPPSIRVRPNVVVSVATAFIRGGFTANELIEGWEEQGAKIGIREYYAIIHWDKDLPRVARAARLDYLSRTIPDFYKKGARFTRAEGSDNWGPTGLGQYIAARLLWDVREADHLDDLIDDFLTKSFGPAKEPMRKFYGLLVGQRGEASPPLSEDYVGRLYSCLGEAYKLTTDTATRARLDDLACYVRYVEMYSAYKASGGEERQQRFEGIIRFAYRIRASHMLHSLAIYRTRFRDDAVTVPAAAKWNVPETDKAGKPLNPWKTSEPIPPAEIQAFVSAGIQNNKPLTFVPKSFSENLVPATKLNLKPAGMLGYTRFRGEQNFLVYADRSGTLTLTVVAGLIFQNRGAARVTLYAADAAATAEADAVGEEEGADENAEPVAPPALDTAEVAPDQKGQTVTLKVPRAGLYRVRVQDSQAGTFVAWPEGTPVAVRSPLSNTTVFTSRWKMYFYVPKGTKSVGGFGYGHGKIYDADGKPVLEFPAKPGYFDVPVGAGQAGRLWTFESINGQIGLMTVPPFLARNEKELLLPQEVVNADAP